MFWLYAYSFTLINREQDRNKSERNLWGIDDVDDENDEDDCDVANEEDIDDIYGDEEDHMLDEDFGEDSRYW